MKILASILSIVFMYSVSLAQGTSYGNQAKPMADPPAKTAVKKEQRFERGDLKGPRAKNHPDYRYKSSKVAVTAPATVSEKRVGPAAKNYKPWQDDTRTQHVIVTKKEKKDLKGPRAKNRKPWDNR